ncbi:STAS domain-containing protein [Streptomyces sp. NPDC087420]|uniref:STAS domain-containing protein n=1 Tax=Streptomyces sp. NPDC087420 TaxID=3365785 RepID=UPI003837A778
MMRHATAFVASHAVTRAGDARVTLTGELDHTTAPQVREAVAACMAERPKSLRLDLNGVGFCDCSGLSVLLETRLSVLLAGADLVVAGIGAQLARLISLIGAGDILAEGRVSADSILARSE